MENKQQLPDAEKHQIISFIKSGIRIGGCILGLYFNSLGIALWSLGLAEVVGIVEELV